MTRSRLTVVAAAVTVDALATAVDGRATAELGPRHGAELRLRIKLWLPAPSITFSIHYYRIYAAVKELNLDRNI